MESKNLVPPLRYIRVFVPTPGELGIAASKLLEFAGDTRRIAFFGEMGSGKTTFIREICRVLGVLDNVSSPTFSLINEYRNPGGKLIYHFDFYRINSGPEAFDLGLGEYFDSGNFCLIEWPEKILNLLPDPFVRVNIEKRTENRLITFSYD
ncbi:MAG: tRNA (adenosine(37)-N6)-threonylcarbamoyltransferase complex ATPase subunit type 1 TsaE [Bacteroidia bacterium]|nr:tRNA (adenosine(37)-N6)-threonylcarbamoyltransferase complex ATPase subunit type 1 TsaE [Bacteroidia bacterium]